jgi:hypothetical protein
MDFLSQLDALVTYLDATGYHMDLVHEFDLCQEIDVEIRYDGRYELAGNLQEPLHAAQLEVDRIDGV